MRQHSGKSMAAVSITLGMALFIGAPALAQTTVAGVTSGALSVDETGSAGYTISIAVPPGVAGMQPSLALVYKSHGGNGTAGVGWSLSASSSIHRCGQTLVQDGAIHGVDFSAEDRFCLDGQRLVAVSGAYGADGTEYRTEIDGFARVMSHGAAGSGPLSFTVESKSGRTLDYGNTADSRLGVPGQDEIRLWSLSRVTDTLGNAMTYHYIEDPADKSYRLDKVAYAYDAAVTTAKSEVRLIYEARPDTRTSYLTGAELAMTKRLSKVETYADSGTGLALVKDYRLTYELSPTTSRSRITAIKECDASNNCLAPVTPNWSDASMTLMPVNDGQVYNYNFDGPNLYIRNTGDFDGDGISDVVWMQNTPSNTRAYVGRGNGDGTFAAVSPNGGQVHSGNFTNAQTFLEDVGDFDGDGLADVLWTWNGASGSSAYAGLSNGDGTFSGSGGTVYPSSFGSLNNYEPLVGDFNGDGQSDFVWTWSGLGGSKACVAQSNGDGTFSGVSDAAAGCKVHSFSFGSPGTYSPRVGDFNGDGRADIGWLWSGPSGSRFYVGLSNGDGTFTSINSGQVHTGFSFGNPGTYQGVTEDFNSDGLTDVGWVWSGGNGSRIYVGLSRGDGSFEPVNTGQVHTFSFGNPSTYYFRSGDFNGDGLTDVGWAWSSTGGSRLYIGTGNGDGTFEPINTGQVHTLSFGNPANFYYEAKVGDFNGDGRSDVTWMWSGGAGARAYTGLLPEEIPDLLTSVTDSLGRVSTITYRPLTDDTVYTKDSDAVFPVVDIQAPLYVVKAVSTDDGIGGQAVTSYGYVGAKVHVQGRGFRGFRQMTATDEQTGIVTTTDYHQTFPYTAQVTQSAKTLADGTTIKTIDNTWDQLSLNGGDTVYPYVAASTSEDYEINDGLGNAPVVSRTASAVFDTFGNPTSLTTATTGGGESFTETTVNTYTNDTVNWFLGLLTRSEVTRSRGAP